MPATIHPSLFRIMGIVNITPDSFSDGGRYLGPQQAVEQAMRLLEDGADVLDLGAESARPGAVPVDVEGERQRLMPVLDRLLKMIPASQISVDTRRTAIALEVAAMGVGYINNVEGLMPDPVMSSLKDLGCSYIAMHMHGEPGTMQERPLGREAALNEVDHFLATALKSFELAGFSRQKRFFDPGIGFGKTDSGNLALMASLPRYAEKCQVAVGISRKSMFGRLLGISVPDQRDDACKVPEFLLGVSGASLIRTHDVKRLAKIRKVFAEDR
jgi:dihydropteroate synthase